jgi:hypothetical protein
VYGGTLSGSLEARVTQDRKYSPLTLRSASAHIYLRHLSTRHTPTFIPSEAPLRAHPFPGFLWTLYHEVLLFSTPSLPPSPAPQLTFPNYMLLQVNLILVGTTLAEQPEPTLFFTRP